MNTSRTKCYLARHTRHTSRYLCRHLRALKESVKSASSRIHKAKLFFKHEGYSMMYTSYHVPANSCTPYELMRKVDKDRNVLLRLRCAPLNEFYSMLMEDTPGYIPSPHWSKPPIHESSSTTRRNSRSVSRSPDHLSPIKSVDESPSVKNARSIRDK
jgi:hypothetical protein